MSRLYTLFNIEKESRKKDIRQDHQVFLGWDLLFQRNSTQNLKSIYLVQKLFWSNFLQPLRWIDILFIPNQWTLTWNLHSFGYTHRTLMSRSSILQSITPFNFPTNLFIIKISCITMKFHGIITVLISFDFNIANVTYRELHCKSVIVKYLNYPKRITSSTN